jgi:hypothetical protein
VHYRLIAETKNIDQLIQEGAGPSDPHQEISLASKRHLQLCFVCILACKVYDRSLDLWMCVISVPKFRECVILVLRPFFFFKPHSKSIQSFFVLIVCMES